MKNNNINFDENSDEKELNSDKSTDIEYTSSSISVLEGIEAIRKYPGMYIGSVNNPNHLVNEVLDNSVDESLMGYCNKIWIEIVSLNKIKIRDKGRGIPHDKHSSGMLACEIVFLKIHAGGKFDTNTYKKSGGLHGVGLTAVNALCKRLIVKSHRNEETCTMLFERGVLKSTEMNPQENENGTEIIMESDEDIFDSGNFDIDEIYQRLKYISALNPNLSISFLNHLDAEVEEELINTDKGIETLVIDKCTEPLLRRNIEILDRGELIEVEAYINWNKSEKDEDFMSFTNCIMQKDYGTHVTGIKNGCTKFLEDIKEINEISPTLLWSDIKKGIVCSISIRMQNPKFDSQSKNRLVSSEVRKRVEEICYKNLKESYRNNSLMLQPLIDHIKHLLIIKSVKTKKDDLSLSAFMYEGRLIDCRETDPAKREIFIVEGESAGGSIKQCRNKDTQAILTLRGKILNVEKANIKQIVHSETLSIIASALGGQYLSNGTVLLDEIKYGKIIILVDADVDGSHIRSLLLTLFYRHMPEIIHTNKIFIGTPPLYRVQGKDKSIYFNKSEELAKYLTDTVCNKHLTSIKIDEKERKLIEAILDIFSENIETRNDDFSITLIDILAFLKIKLHSELMEKFEMFKDHVQRTFLNLECYLGNNQCIIIEDFSTLKKIIINEETFNSKLVKLNKRLLAKTNEKSFEKLDSKSRNDFGMGIFKKIYACFLKIEDDMVIQRFKGLGEMNPDQLYETSMDPLKRKLKQICINDAIRANNLCNILMGDDPDKRKKFIMEHYDTKSL